MEVLKMIMRVYRCTVVAGKEAEFREYAFTKSYPWLRERPGLIAFYAGRPLPDSGDRHPLYGPNLGKLMKRPKIANLPTNAQFNIEELSVTC
jgi:hypothetical protein